LLLSAAIQPADVQDRDGAIPLLRAARRLFPFVEVIFADGAYRGEATAKAVAGTGRWRLEIVSRGDAEGFVPLAKRWIVIACTELPNRGSSGPRRSSEGGCARWAMTTAVRG
jgi:transposase